MILKRYGRTIKKGWSYQGKLMVVFVYDPENYIDNGMTVDVGNGKEGMGETWEDHKGLPGSDGQKYMNGVVV